MTSAHEPTALDSDDAETHPHEDTEFNILERHYLRAVVFFVCGTLLLSCHSVLVTADGGRASFWRFEGAAHRYYFSELAFAQNGGVGVVCDGASAPTTSAAYGVAVATLIVGFVLVLPTICAMYLNADATTAAALGFSARVATVALVFFVVFSALALTLVILVAVERHALLDASMSYAWPWVMMLVVCVLSFILISGWAIWRVYSINEVKPSFPQAGSGAEAEGGACAPSTRQQRRKQQQHHQQQEHDDAVLVTFYRTRSHLAKMMLLIAIVLAATCSAMSSFAWISTETGSAFSPVYGRCVVVSESSTAAQFAAVPTSSCAEHYSSTVMLGLNGTALAMAVLLAMGSVLGWTWCLVPLCFTAFAILMAAIGITGRAANACSLSLGWAFWVEVVAAILWLCAGVAGTVIQLCVPDRSDVVDE